MKNDQVLMVYCDLLGDYLLFRNHWAHARKILNASERRLHFVGNAAARPLIEHLDGHLADSFSWVSDYRPFTLTPKKLLKLPLLAWKTRRLMDDMGVPRSVEAVWHPSMGPWVTNQLALFTRAPRKIARDVEDAGLHRLQKFFYQELYRPDNFYTFVFDQHRAFFELATGVSFREVTFSFPRESLLGLYAGPPLLRPYCLIFPDSAEAYKQWPVRSFAELIRHIRKEAGLFVYLCGHGANRALGESIVHHTEDAGVTNLMGRTSLVESFDLIGGSEFVVCNDSFALHASNAMATPVLCVTEGLYFGRYLPYPQVYRKSEHEYVLPESPVGCLSDIRPEQAIRRLEGLLRHKAAKPIPSSKEMEGG